MQELANRGRYKTISLLRSEAGNEVFSAVNIEDAEQKEVLVCRFGNSNEVRRLLPIFYETQERGCEELVEIFSEYGSFCVVFQQCRGQPLGQLLPCTDPLLRRQLQEALFCRVLELSCLPPEFCNAAVQPKLAVWLPDAGKIDFQLQLDARNVQAGDGCLNALSKMSEKILHRGLFTMYEELNFLDRLRGKEIKTVGEGYTAWRELCAATAQSYGEHYAKNEVSLALYGMKTWLSRRREARSYQRQYRY